MPKPDPLALALLDFVAAMPGQRVDDFAERGIAPALVFDPASGGAVMADRPRKADGSYDYNSPPVAHVAVGRAFSLLPDAWRVQPCLKPGMPVDEAFVRIGAAAARTAAEVHKLLCRLGEVEGELARLERQRDAVRAFLGLREPEPAKVPTPDPAAAEARERNNPHPSEAG